MTERMGVLSSDGRCLQPSPLAARAMLRPAARRLAAVGIGFAGGWAVLYGALMPFGLGLPLGLAEDCFAPCAAGAALGLLLHGLGALSLRSLCQLCALGAAVAARWLLPQKFVPAALAGCGTLTGMALCFALGSSGADLLLYSAADALLAAGIGFGLRKFAPERPGMGTLLVGAAVAAAGLGCATAAAAVLAPGRRVETLAAYAGGCVSGVLCVQPPGNAFGLLFSACGGMAVVCLLPGGWLVPVADTPQSGENAPAPARSAAASTRLEAVAQSLSSLAETVNAVYEGLPRRREGFRWVIDNVHDTLCFNCGRRETCWKQEYTATMAGMEALRPLLEQNGSVEAAQLPGELSRCIHPAALCAAAGRSFALYRSRKEARIHSEAMRTALTEQYSAVAEALGVLSEQLGRPGDPEPYKSSRVAEFFTGLGAPPQECAVTLDDLGRTHAAVTLPRTRFTPQELAALAGEVGHICRRTLEVPQVLSCKGMTTLLFSERPALRAVFGAASAAARGEVSGDAVQQFCSPTAAQMILCDGMGTGRPAAVDGNLAAELTARLLKAGFTAELAARLVNVALALKSEDESGATLDLISVDLYTGTARLFKAGAAPGFLVHGGRVRAVGEATLP
uniref:SpoIIE family protein phosphatase n=1 Tax=Faecalibacterium prausnitzii TaxID=853 RepID=UPI004029A1B5